MKKSCRRRGVPLDALDRTKFITAFWKAELVSLSSSIPAGTRVTGVTGSRTRPGAMQSGMLATERRPQGGDRNPD